LIAYRIRDDEVRGPFVPKIPRDFDGMVRLPWLGYRNTARSGATTSPLGRNDELVAFYPASIGSNEKPALSGTFRVRRIVKNPTYHPAVLILASACDVGATS